MPRYLIVKFLLIHFVELQINNYAIQHKIKLNYRFSVCNNRISKHPSSRRTF